MEIEGVGRGVRDGEGQVRGAVVLGRVGAGYDGREGSYEYILVRDLCFRNPAFRLEIPDIKSESFDSLQPPESTCHQPNLQAPLPHNLPTPSPRLN